MFKKILLGLVVLVLLVAGGAFYMYSNLDHWIKVAIEKYGTAATQTAVKLDSVKLSLADGQGSLSGLSIDNPQGFSGNVKAFYLGNIQVKVDVNSIRGSGEPKISFRARSGSGGSPDGLRRGISSEGGRHRIRPVGASLWARLSFVLRRSGGSPDPIRKL